MKISTLLPGALVLEPRIFVDNRGHFLETYQAQRYAEAGLPAHFVQDNLSFSQHGVLRGLHYQLGQPQGKLVFVVQGTIFDVVVDIRKSSPNFGRWASVVLEAKDYRQLYVSPGFAHGFWVMSEQATVIYKCTDYYAPREERGVIWNDPALGIPWPEATPLLSEKDAVYPRLQDIPADQLPE